MDFLDKRNSAVAINGNCQNNKCVDIAITARGSDFYFAICGVMGFVGFGVIAASMMKPRVDRIFFYITAAINFTACIAYFAMGSNLGWTPIDVEWQRTGGGVGGTNREVFYVRYIDWFVTTPLLLFDLLLTAGIPWPTILFTVFLDEVMIVTGLVGALVKSRYKWGFYAAGCLAMFGIFWNLAGQSRMHSKHLGMDVYRAFLVCGVWTLFIWLLYPIAWGVSEGGNVIPPDSEAVFYGVLDFCAKPVFSIMLIAAHWNIDPGRMGLKLRDYTTDPDYFGCKDGGQRKHVEKERNGINGTDGVTNGHTNGHAEGVPNGYNVHTNSTTNGTSYAGDGVGTTPVPATGDNVVSAHD